jgi:hypothetical protein
MSAAATQWPESWRRARFAFALVPLTLSVLVLLPATAEAAQVLPAAPSWSTNTSKSLRVRAITKLGNTVYIGGEFTTISPVPGAPPVDQPYLFAMDATTGAFRSAFRPRLAGPAGTTFDPLGVLSLEIDPASGALFVGGNFTKANDQNLTGLAVLDPVSGELKRGAAQHSVGMSGARASVNAIKRWGSEIYVGGNFTTIAGQTRRHLARLDLPTLSLDPWRASLGGRVRSIALDGAVPNRVFVGGDFIGAGANLDGRASYLASFGTVASEDLVSWFPNLGSGGPRVNGLDAAGGRVFAAVGGPGGRLVVYDAAPGQAEPPERTIRTDGDGQAVNVVGNVVYFGGHFDSVLSPATARSKLVGLDLQTLQILPTPHVLTTGAFGVWAIYGESNPNDVWWGGEWSHVADLSGTGLGLRTGNLVHFVDGFPADTQPPAAPGRPVVSQQLGTMVELRWPAAADNRGILGYVVYVNGTAKHSVSGLDTSLWLPGLSPSATYQITVRAIDVGRNQSPPSLPVAITTRPLRGLGLFSPVNPARVLDTRSAVGAPRRTPLAAGEELAVTVAGAGGVPAGGAGVVALNVTVTQPTATGFLTVFANGTRPPPTSNLNFAPSQTVPNLVLARVGSGGQVKVVVSAGRAHVVMDVVGWFGSDQSTVPGSRIVAQAPTRVLDTRAGAKVGPGRTIDVRVAPAGTKLAGVVMNLTGTQPSAATFVTAYPADLPGRPPTSNLNLAAGQTRPNLVMVRVPPSGLVRLYNHAGSTHLIVDVMGRFEVTAGLDNVPAGRLLALDAAVRVVDTRVRAPLRGPGTATWSLAQIDASTPGEMVGAVVNATATQASAPTYLTVFPAGGARPVASNLNVRPGQNTANLVVGALSPDDRISVFNAAGTVHHILDLTAIILG